MSNNSNPSYFRNGETTDFSFFRIPRILVKDERFHDLSTDAKLLYGLMLDRMGLSLQNGWQDTEGRTFIYFTLKEIQTNLSCGHNKAVRLLAELEQYALIERVKQGQGKPAKIYVKKISAANADSGEGTENNSISPEASDLQKSEKPTCSPPVLKRLDFPKGDGNYTDKNYTEFSYINPSIDPNHPQPTSPPLPPSPIYLQHTDSAAGGAVPASMSFVKHKRLLVRGHRPLKPLSPENMSRHETY